VFALNRSLDEPMKLSVDVRGFSELSLTEALEMHDADLQAVNTHHEPERVMPSRLEDVQVGGHTVQATLRPASWNVIRARAPR
jgi:alpha-N-arabinofuranosidase